MSEYDTTPLGPGFEDGPLSAQFHWSPLLALF